MPKTGYKTVTVSLDVFTKLSNLAKQFNLSIPETIQKLLELEKNNV